MTDEEEEVKRNHPGIMPHQIAWRLKHPLIPDAKYARILELETTEMTGIDYYGNEEEAHEILGEYYPEEAE